MTKNDQACRELECYQRCQELHALAMSAVMVDLVARGKKDPVSGAKDQRDQTWADWEEHRNLNCYRRYAEKVPAPDPICEHQHWR